MKIVEFVFLFYRKISISLINVNNVNYVDLEGNNGLSRFKDILLILIKYGFADIVERLDLPIEDLIGKKTDSAYFGLNQYQRIRAAIEELSPTFIKLGQLISVRPDLIPLDLTRELSRLQDQVAPVEFSVIKKTIENELGKPIKKLFQVFDEKPLACASLSQVHKAVFSEKGPVLAVKVQRPGLRNVVESDLAIIETIAHRLHAKSDQLKIYDLPEIVRSSKRSLYRELDFEREARNIQIARAKLKKSGDIIIPQVFSEYCTKKVLVTKYIKGTGINDLTGGSHVDRFELAGKGLRSGIYQILYHGFFHADPHPGNLLISAMIIGSSMIITTGVEPFLFGFPALGVIGYLISAVFGLWLIFIIIRNRPD